MQFFTGFTPCTGEVPIFGAMNKVLVTGANGQLGKAIRRLSPNGEFTFLTRDALNLSHTASFAKRLADEDFDAIVNCAAYTAVDQAEVEPHAAHTINADAPEALARICQERNAALWHISTDYVYDGTANRPLTEDHPTAPTGAYGRSKCKGEEAVRRILKKHCIVRTSWLYGPDGKNFMLTMLRLGSATPELRVVCDQVGTPTFTDHLAGAIILMVRRYLSANGDMPWGTYHYSNEGVASWYDFAQAIFEYRNLDVRLRPVLSHEYPTKAVRPAYSVLHKQKIKDTFGLEIPHWRTALHECLQLMNHHIS